MPLPTPIAAPFALAPAATSAPMAFAAPAWPRLSVPRLLAQFDDDPPPPPDKPQPHPMTFSDLQQGLRDVHDGKVDNSAFRNGILGLLITVAVVALIIHLRQRKKTAAPPDSMRKLARELGRHVRFPLGTKLLLRWVARATRTPFPALLLSSALFDQCVHAWAADPNLALARHWGRSRLARLRPRLFE